VNFDTVPFLPFGNALLLVQTFSPFLPSKCSVRKELAGISLLQGLPIFQTSKLNGICVSWENFFQASTKMW